MFKIKHGWGGAEFTTEEGLKLEHTENFKAKLARTGQSVIIIFVENTIRDHGGSWEVKNALVFDEVTLEKVELRHGVEYTWFEESK